MERLESYLQKMEQWKISQEDLEHALRELQAVP